ncbi:MAG: phosphoribosylglycinamide formyltransferase [Lachnospiraceae bacterium]|uniref:Phosphoribosylglycinamide formyltransferase n=1 Tax=Candidatus Weimeria bifida TaxID=2599074 RepID=A0A6N7J1C3_9FIRM|nr:phosphoribosylglycinamide formyltransferase [Candidatus Weimeria bifida]RRF96499.1 MAG: phosphoribosylglycinamide formyltransferase [Lachnospiraceae bacterium]
MLKLAVLVSGGGTNLQAIMDAIDRGKQGQPGLTRLIRENKDDLTPSEICGMQKEAAINDAYIGIVISNNPNAYALKRAEAHGIKAECLSPKAFDSRADYNRALLEKLKAENVDLVVLAGFLVVIPPEVVSAYPNRVVNIHPALIPAFCGKGYYGLHVHEGALGKGVKVSGATVHFVDAGTDTGPIIMQKAVYVRDDDTPEKLQRRIMEQAEWKLLPGAVDLIAHDMLTVENRVVSIKESE